MVASFMLRRWCGRLVSGEGNEEWYWNSKGRLKTEEDDAAKGWREIGQSRYRGGLYTFPRQTNLEGDLQASLSYDLRDAIRELLNL